MNTTEILMAAKAQISDRSNWCQGAHARNACGHSVTKHSPNAVAWCAHGAIRATAKIGDYRKAVELADEAAMTLGSFNIVALNDSDPDAHPLVLEMFDLAIARSREERSTA